MTVLAQVLVGVLIAAQPQGSPITGAVVDGDRKPIAGAEIVFSAGMTFDGSVPILDRAITDGSGRFSLARPAAERLRGFSSQGVIWARKAGFGIGIVDLAREDRPSQAFQIVLEMPHPRTLIFRDQDGQPLAGLRVAPRLLRTELTIFQGVAIPDDWLNRIATTTGADGTARINCLGTSTRLRIARAATRGGGLHFAGVPHFQQTGDATLVLRRPAQLSGTVVTESDTPGPRLKVELWQRCMTPASADQTMYLPPEPIRLEGGPIETDQAGAFETPNVLFTGATYRAVVTAPGYAPLISDWITLSGTTNRLPPLKLRRLRTLTGIVVDRQGKPIADALMSQPGGPVTTSDNSGRFRLQGAAPGRSFLLARRDGFRVQGWLIEPHEDGEIELTLSRPAEPAVQVKATLPPPLPLEKTRTLAHRIISSYLRDSLAKGNDTAKVWTLDVERWLDPTAFVEQVQKTKFEREGAASVAFGRAALVLASTDLEEASAVAETIPGLDGRCDALIGMADHLPAGRPRAKLDLLARAAFLARSAQFSSAKLYVMGEVGERWLEMNEPEKARTIFAEGRKLVEALPAAKRTDAGSFLARMARVEPAAAIALLENVGASFWRQRLYANMAIRLAYEHPAEAEDVFNRLDEPIWRDTTAQRICRRLATIDGARARRIAAGLPDPAQRAYAWAFLADGLSATDRERTREALDQAIREIDLDDHGRSSRRLDANPAASILPLVESIAPELVAEVFWRAVALHPMPGDPRIDLATNPPSTSESLLLSRYDREVAAVLLEPVVAYARSRAVRQATDIDPSIVLALAAIDPAAAVALVESLPAAKTLDINEPANLVRQALAEHLSMPPERRWMRIWRFQAGCGMAMFEENYRDL